MNRNVDGPYSTIYEASLETPVSNRSNWRRKSRISNRFRTSRRVIPYVLTAPALVYLVLFLAYPVFEGLRLSATNANFLNPSAAQYIGFSNYVEVLGSNSGLASIRTTLVYAVACVAGGIGLGLASALLMNRPFKGVAIVRGAVMVPWASPHVVVALVFVWMLNPQFGIVNFAAQRAGLIDGYQRWLTDPDTALITVIVLTIWTIFPISALVLLAALQAVPKELYEAASTDGAKGASTFTFVTLPGIAPTLWLLVLLSTIWALRRFELLWLTTQGGPAGRTNVMTIELYRQAFRHHRLGYAAAIGVIGLAISLLVAGAYYILERRRERTGGAV